MIGPDPDLSHPSYLELDRLFLLAPGPGSDPEPDPADAALHAAAVHLQDCARCQSYLTALQRRAAAPVPAWARALPARRPGVWTQLVEQLRPHILFPVAAAAASLALVVATQSGPLRRTPSPASAPNQRPAVQVRAKGGPSVSVFIKRGEQVTQWDGRTRLRAEDRIRLQVAGAGYTQVTVALQRPGGAQVLYTGELHPAAPTPLPVSWQVSADDASEIIEVILSPQQLREAAPARPLDVAALRQRRELWITELVMQKEESR